MINKIRIWWLKRRLKKIILAKHAIYDDYLCGHSIVDFLSPRIAHLKNEQAQIIATLRVIDPEFPQ